MRPAKGLTRLWSMGILPPVVTNDNTAERETLDALSNVNLTQVEPFGILHVHRAER